MVEKRIQDAIDEFNRIPRATKQTKLMFILISRTKWSDGLTKNELAAIFYKEQLQRKEVNTTDAKNRISGLLSGLRRNYPTAMIYSTRNSADKSSLKGVKIVINREFRNYWLSTQADVNKVIKMLENIIAALEKTVVHLTGYELKVNIENRNKIIKEINILKRKKKKRKLNA